MTIEITAVRFKRGIRRHSRIVRVQRRNIDSGALGESSVASVIHFINGGGIVQVASGSDRVDVGIVTRKFTHSHVRARSNGTWTNELLELETF